jgi:hypothetical protein
MKKRKDILHSDSRGVIPTAKGSRLLDAGFFYQKMKSTKSTPRNETLDAVVTAQAKREARRLGVELSVYIANLAAKADTLPVTARIRMEDIGRINARVGGGRVHQWVEDVVAGALNGNRVTLDLEPEMAAELREAAEFEGMSVSEYLMDGLTRDLALSKDIQAAEKN